MIRIWIPDRSFVRILAIEQCAHRDNVASGSRCYYRVPSSSLSLDLHAFHQDFGSAHLENSNEGECRIQNYLTFLPQQEYRCSCRGRFHFPTVHWPESRRVQPIPFRAPNFRPEGDLFTQLNSRSCVQHVSNEAKNEHGADIRKCPTAAAITATATFSMPQMRERGANLLPQMAAFLLFSLSHLHLHVGTAALMLAPHAV